MLKISRKFFQPRTALWARNLGHDNHHAQPAGPFQYPNFRYPKDKYAKKGATNDEEAHFGGNPPGSAFEGWEYIYIITMLSSVTLCIISGFSNDSDISVWARQEVLAREKAVKMGHQLEHGKFFNKVIEVEELDDDGKKTVVYKRAYEQEP